MSTYPSELPNPTKASHTPKVRNFATDLEGPASYANRERDFTRTIAVEFFFTAEQAAIFYAWWRDDLLYGGKWFNCSWPSLTAGSTVAQLLGEPSFDHVYNGAHRIALLVQVRGATLPISAGSAPQVFTSFFGENLAPAAAVSGSPVAARDAFLAGLTLTETLTFETKTVQPYYSGLTHAFTGNQAGLSLALSTTGTDGSYLEVTTNLGNGRFNTTPAGSKFLEFYDDVILNFSSNINALGFYGTDWGDFDGRVKVTLTDAADAETTYDVPHTVPADNASLIFWGFTHPGAAYKRVRLFCTYTTPPGYGEGDYFGVDDLIVGLA